MINDNPVSTIRGQPHPETGQFTTQDPLDGMDGTPTVANPYHYVDNDPLNAIDPLGLQRDDDEDSCSANVDYGESRPVRLTATFASDRARGTVRVGLYIPTESAGMPGVSAMRSHGDDRGPCATAKLSQFRAVATLDYVSGRAEFRINPSCGLGKPPGDCHDPLPLTGNFSRASRWLQRIPLVVHDSNRVSISEEAGESLKVRWAIINSDKRLLAPAIDGSVTILKTGSDGVCAEYHRDAYPSMEIYQYVNGETRTILLQDAAHNADRGLMPTPFTDKDGWTCES